MRTLITTCMVACVIMLGGCAAFEVGDFRWDSTGAALCDCNTGCNSCCSPCCEPCEPEEPVGLGIDEPCIPEPVYTSPCTGEAAPRVFTGTPGHDYSERWGNGGPDTVIDTYIDELMGCEPDVTELQEDPVGIGSPDGFTTPVPVAPTPDPCNGNFGNLGLPPAGGFLAPPNGDVQSPVRQKSVSDVRAYVALPGHAQVGDSFVQQVDHLGNTYWVRTNR